MKIPYIPIIFTLIILYVAVTQLDWHALFTALAGADPYYIGLALLMWVGVVFFKAFKWQRMVAALGGTISLAESVKVLFIALFVSIITPGRLGDFVRAIYIKKNLTLGKGVMAVLVDRAMDVISLLVFSCIGLILLTEASGIEIISTELVVALIVGSIAALYIILNRRIAVKLFRPFEKWVPTNFRALIIKHGRTFYESIPLFRKNMPQVFFALASSTLAWFASITFGWYLMIALSFPLEWSVALAVIPILALIEIIPVGILGVGTREIGAVIVLGTVGISAEGAIAFSLLFFALGYIPSFVTGAILFNKHPIPMDGGLAGLAKQLSK